MLRIATRVLRAWLAVAGFFTAAGAYGADCEGDVTPYRYPIVLRGAAALVGQRIADVAVYARHASTWSAIPFQIDEVNSQGDYVLRDGLPFTKNTDDGVFDANDEFVVWGEDLGEGVAPEEVPSSLRDGATAAFAASFCRKGAPLGSVVIVIGKAKPAARHGARPPSGDQVRFDKSQGTVTTDLYRYTFKEGHPALLGEVALRKNGEEYPVFARSDFLMPLSTAWFLPDLTFRSDEFESVIESWQSGPLRTIVAVGVKYTSFFGLVRLHLFTELVFYRNRFQIPTVIEFLFEPGSLLKPGSGLAYSLTFPEGKDWEIRSNLERLPAEDPGRLVEKRGSKVEVFHASGSRPEGSFFVQVMVDEEAKKQVPPPYLIGRPEFKGEAWKKHWPWLGEIPGDFGLYLDISMVKQGAYDFGLDLVLSPKAKESFTDYGFVDVEWSRVPILDFRAPE